MMERITDLDQSLAAIQAPLNLDGLSYEEYFKRIEEMIGQVRQHWRSEQRVKALKVVIQLTKLLADTSQIKLYAKKYKMIVDLLDEFGRLVHKRIHSLAHEEPAGSTESSSSSKFSDQTNSKRRNEKARDTCRNWFLKVASIRELVPRFYTEISIIRSCDILLKSSSYNSDQSSPEELALYSQSLMRLTKAAWGFGDPIVALHARAYLCRAANQLISWTEDDSASREANRSILFEIIRANLKASVIVVSQLNSLLVGRALRVQNVNMWSFFDLLSSALQAISNTIVHKDDLYTNEDELSESATELFETMFSDSIEALNKDCSLLACNIVLHSIIRSMPASIIVRHNQIILQTIRGSYESWIEFRGVMDEVRQTLPTFYATLESLALALDASREFEQRHDLYLDARRDVFVFAHKIIDQLVKDDLKEASLSTQSFKCFKAWLSYCNHYLDSKTIDEFLAHFIELIRRDLQQQSSNSTNIVELIKVLTAGRKNVDEYRRLFAMKSFHSLLDLLKRDDLKLEAARLIFETMRIELKLSGKRQQVTGGDKNSCQLVIDETGRGASNIQMIEDKRMIEFIRTKLFATINDSLGLLAADDDIDQLSQLVILFLDLIRLPDFVERLDFLSKCRSSLANLNPILEYLARQAYRLSIDYRQSERRRNQRRNYLNGCLAFAFVTIPALHNPLIRLELLVEGVDLALGQMSLSLADYYLKQVLLNLTDLLVRVGANTSSSGGSSSSAGGVGGPTTMSRDFDERRNSTTTTTATTTTTIKVIQHAAAGATNRISNEEKLVVKHVKSILNLMLKHQDYIDLRYKLALYDLIEGSFSHLNQLDDYTELLEQSKFLKLVLDEQPSSSPPMPMPPTLPPINATIEVLSASEENIVVADVVC